MLPILNAFLLTGLPISELTLHFAIKTVFYEIASIMRLFLSDYDTQMIITGLLRIDRVIRMDLCSN